ncbi:MAG: RNA polymerase sigma factor [Thermocrispum sp.]
MSTAFADRHGTTPAGRRCPCESDLAGWYDNHARSLRAFILARTHDPDVADDCTSKTYLRAVARRTSFRCTGESVRPWLFTIARNVVHDHLHSAAVRREVSTESFADVTDASTSPEQQLLRHEVMAQLLACVERLPHDQARCIRLRFFADLSVAETARQLGRPDGAVRALQYRAVRGLRTMLADAS